MLTLCSSSLSIPFAAGKSTLLRILAGKRLVPNANALLLGKDVFRSPPAGVTYLGTEWAMNPVVRGDIVVGHFLDSVGGYRHKARRDRLLEILDVDLDWCGRARLPRALATGTHTDRQGSRTCSPLQAHAPDLGRRAPPRPARHGPDGASTCRVAPNPLRPPR